MAGGPQKECSAWGAGETEEGEGEEGGQGPLTLNFLPPKDTKSLSLPMVNLLVRMWPKAWDCDQVNSCPFCCTSVMTLEL